MSYLLLLKDPQRWEDAIKTGIDLVQKGETYLLVMDEAVIRCIRCEPTLFRYLHQFILDGGQAFVCENSLARYEISSTRPPEVFNRIKEGKKLISKKKILGWEIREF